MVHTTLLKLLLWVLGISGSAPLLELSAYAGYPFVAACGVLVARLTLGEFGLANVDCVGYSYFIYEIGLLVLCIYQICIYNHLFFICRRSGLPRCLGILQCCNGGTFSAHNEAGNNCGSAAVW